MGGKGRARERRRKREEVAFLHFLQFNDCSAVIVAATYTRTLDLALQLVCSSGREKKMFSSFDACTVDECDGLRDTERRLERRYTERRAVKTN